MIAQRLSILALLAVAGCGGQLLFDKPGAAPGSGQGDLTDCEVEALAKVPPNNQLRRTSSWPATTSMNCIGSRCTATTWGGESSAYTVDANAALRDRVLIQCMADKGYTLRQ
jgi:hypothetical protein